MSLQITLRKAQKLVLKEDWHGVNAYLREAEKEVDLLTRRDAREIAMRQINEVRGRIPAEIRYDDPPF